MSRSFKGGNKPYNCKEGKAARKSLGALMLQGRVGGEGNRSRAAL